MADYGARIAELMKRHRTQRHGVEALQRAVADITGSELTPRSALEVTVNAQKTFAQTEQGASTLIQGPLSFRPSVRVSGFLLS